MSINIIPFPAAGKELSDIDTLALDIRDAIDRLDSISMHNPRRLAEHYPMILSVAAVATLAAGRVRREIEKSPGNEDF